MKFKTNLLMVNFDIDFVKEFDQWKMKVLEKQDSLKDRLKYLIRRDLSE